MVDHVVDRGADALTDRGCHQQLLTVLELKFLRKVFILQRL
jgi:hypothetical protein